jgi:hypothetical protein
MRYIMVFHTTNSAALAVCKSPWKRTRQQNMRAECLKHWKSLFSASRQCLLCQPCTMVHSWTNIPMFSGTWCKYSYIDQVGVVTLIGQEAKSSGIKRVSYKAREEGPRNITSGCLTTAFVLCTVTSSLFDHHCPHAQVTGLARSRINESALIWLGRDLTSWPLGRMCTRTG